jgi:hypothetical protein
MNNEMCLISSFQAHLTKPIQMSSRRRGLATMNFNFTPRGIPGHSSPYIWTNLCYTPHLPIPYSLHPLKNEPGSLFTPSHFKMLLFAFLLSTKPAADPALGF